MKLVLIRHGQSVWNLKKIFTGWTDVELTDLGTEEARRSGEVLKKNGFAFDLAFTSVLKRAIETLNICLDEMGLDIPVIKDWRLNERHYGALQGESKEEMVKKFGKHLVHNWRRSYDISPPPLEKNDKRYKKGEPVAESLKDTVERVVPYWQEKIVPILKDGRRIIISAHGNSLRALVKHLDDISDGDIVKVNIATGIPLVYEFDNELNVINRYFLGDGKEVNSATEKFEGRGMTS